MTAPERQARPEASDLGHFEPSPYDLGVTDDPEAEAVSDPWAEGRYEPVPYVLTPEGEAALREAGPCPGLGDLERLAQQCGFPGMAAMDAACEADGRALAAESEAEARWEAECEALAAECEDPEAEL
jgi:hypothetical protein